MNKQQSPPERLYYQLYPTYIEASREQLKKVNKQSYYRISVWQDDTLLGEMIEGASPAILLDKIFLTKAILTFNQRYSAGDLTIKLTEHYDSDKLIGVGSFSLKAIQKKFVENTQRFFSLLEANLTTNDGSFKLIFSLFIQSDKFALSEYIRKFKQNEKDVRRAKRNINNYKREKQRKLMTINETKGENGIEKEEEKQYQYRIHELKRDKGKQSDQISFGSAPPGNYLQINSAAKFHKKKIEKDIKKIKTALNEDEERQFLSYTKIMEEYKAGSHIISAADMQTASLISDGSEESEMRAHNERQTYSDKAIKRFRGNVNTLMNIFFIISAIMLIYFVIAPSKKYTKDNKIHKKKAKPGEILLELLDDD